MSSLTTMSHSQVLSPPPKPRPYRLLRSPSDPVHIHSPSDESPTPPQQIYVLSADGSSLFLLDPTKPQGNEEPPPYAPFRADVELPNNTSSTSLVSNGAVAGPSSPQSALNSVPYPTIVVPEGGRHRASTVSTLNQEATREASRPRMRNHASFSHTHTPHNGQRDDRDVRSANTSPRVETSALADERTPLLRRELGGDEWIEVSWPKRRGAWRAIFCGELEEGDDKRSWGAAWNRFWRPVGKGRYWKAMSHLWFINFPFALLVWPPLLVGTLAGTALLITLPIGAAVWWLTLFIARSAARLETIMQLNYHSPLHPALPQPIYHPIFHRIRERSAPTSPMSEVPPDTEVVWEKRFIKCSYLMFSDHYSYSALSYFLLIKPLIVLFSTIFLIVFFPVAVVLIVTLPVYLRAARRWGQWQAGVAIENL